MYIPAHFAMLDAKAVHAFLRTHVFAVIAGQLGGRINFAYAPVVLDTALGTLGGVRFHLARTNPLAEIGDGETITLSVMGPHAYVSPDWYATEGQVPNYMAVEGAGCVRRLTAAELKCFLGELAAQEESALAPKAPWTMDRVPQARLDGLLHAIVGFELVFETLEGKAKLLQNRGAANVKGAINGLEKRGDAASLAVGAAMRNVRAGEGT